MKGELRQHERIKDELFALVEKTMTKNGITQAEVARRVGAQRYNINKVMREKGSVSIEFLLKIAESIGLEVDLKVKQTKTPFL